MSNHNEPHGRLAELLFVQLMRDAVAPPGSDISEQIAYAARFSINAAGIFYSEWERTP